LRGRAPTPPMTRGPAAETPRTRVRPA
jgi:hypothetical protein